MCIRDRGFGLGDTTYISHLGVEVQILVKMALINEKDVYKRQLLYSLSCVASGICADTRIALATE